MAKESGEKTEKPTPKRKKEAREEGRIPKSPEIAGWLVVLVGTSLMPLFFRTGEARVLGLFTMSADVIRSPTQGGAIQVLQTGLGDFISLVLPLVGAFAALGLVATVAQTGLVLSAKAAKPKFSRISPKAGFKRMVSPSSLWDLVKQILKLTVLGLIAYRATDSVWLRVSGTAPVQMGPIVSYSASVLLTRV